MKSGKYFCEFADEGLIGSNSAWRTLVVAHHHLGTVVGCWFAGAQSLEAWLLACLERLVACTKFDVFGHSNKLGEHLDRMFGVVLFNILKTCLYDLHNIDSVVLLFW